MISALRIGPNVQAFGEVVGILRRHRGLTLEMARAEITSQHAGQMFGAAWAVAHPLFLMALYLFVFGYVFRQRIGGTHELPLDYTAYILSGLVPWLAFQQVMGRATAVLTGQANLVKQVVFPVEILPVTAVATSLLPWAMGMAAQLGYVLVKTGELHATVLLLPVLFVLQLVAMIGVSMVLSCLAAFLRDIREMVTLFTTAGIFAMPVFYLPAWVPPVFKPVLYANPFSYMVWCYQDSLYFGRIEHPVAWVVFPLSSFFVFVIGYRLFRKLKPFFGNVL